MSGRIPREFIDELLVRVDIVDLIDSRVPLKKSGNNFVARCPFHAEKTPSFSVNRKKQFFHCFGCGASGNAIGFLMDFNHLSFVEAIEDLAGFAGLEIPKESTNDQSDQKKENLTDLYALMDQVAAFYVEQLRNSKEGKKAVEYLKKRGIDSNCANEFMLGYAPRQWQALTEQFDKSLLLEAGLIINKETAQFYDRFRDRIMFPIRDKRSRIIGFGGRVLDNSLPKYLNSPETPLFHKNKEVYGLHELLKRNPKPQKIVVVEGYMDVIALAQFGIDYAVATLGTATSQTHIDLLFRFTSELVFCFDGDNAGKEAAWRAMEAAFSCLRDGRQIRIMPLPQNHDPDSLVRTEGIQGFIDRIQTAETLSEYFFRKVSSEINLTELEGKAQLVNRTKPYLEKLPESVYKEMMFARLKELSGWSSLDVSENPTTLIPYQHTKQKTKPDKIKHHSSGRISSARMAIALLIQNPKLAETLEQREIDWNEFEFSGADLLKNILQIIADHNPANTAVLIELYRNTNEEKSVKTLALLDLQIPDEKIDIVFNDSLDRLLIQSRDNALARLLNKSKIEGLDAQEKELLRKMLTDKSLVQSNRNL